uniref:Uncharacterized protein n=1 Tax=Helianthus annuus TaxID=4232 RepID=A0A251TEP4_HELAN
MGWCLISCHYRGDISSVEQGDFFHKTTGDEATKLEVLLQTGGYLLLSSYVYDTCQADAAVAVDAAGTASGESAATTVQKSGGWFGFISDAMEVVLEVHHQKERIRYSRPMRIQPHTNNVRLGQGNMAQMGWLPVVVARLATHCHRFPSLPRARQYPVVTLR